MVRGARRAASFRDDAPPPPPHLRPAADRRGDARAARGARAGVGAAARAGPSATSRRRGWRCGSPTRRRCRRRARSRSCSPPTATSTTPTRCSTASTGCWSAAGRTSIPASTARSADPRLGPDVELVSDEYEQALLRGAAERDLPLLGICRGLQALNVSRGGTLHQHVDEPPPDARDVRARARRRRSSAARCCGWLTGSDGLAVNSFHHQAADRIGAGLEVAARAPDGTVEALWDPAARFTLGVQWHAEFLDPPR